jgi:peptide/nickel transport system permease protein
VSGYVPVANGVGPWAQSLVLPVAALSIGGIAGIAKQTREAMLDALSSEYVRMARANGIGMRSIVLRHALKNAGGRVVTMVGLLAVSLLGGTVLVETVFSLPGLGSLLFTAVQEHDLPVVQGVVICFMIFIVIINFAVDLAYRWLNPKVGLR